MRAFFSKFKWPIVLFSAILLLAAYTGVTTLPYGTNQILARGDVVAQVNSGHFYWKTNPGWSQSDGTLITYSDYTNYVQTSGCTTPTYGVNQLESQAMADTCRQTTTVITTDTDPWLINSGTSWPTQSGSPTFTADTSAPGAPAGAHNVNGTATIWQAINGGATLNTNTTITATAYLKYTTGSTSLSGKYVDSSCTTAASGYLTASGSADVEILNSSGTVVASAPASGSSYATATATYTVPSSGVYYVGVAVQAVTNTQTYYRQATGCIASPVTASGFGYGTDISVSN